MNNLNSQTTTGPPGGVPAVNIRDCHRVLGQGGGDSIEFMLPSLAVAVNDQLALTGPSGCGKSTLLNMISGLAKPDRGAIEVLGTDVVKLGTSAMDSFRGRSIGFIYQSFNLIAGFSALENVLIGMRFGRKIPRGERHERAAKLLERVGLGRRMDVRPERLSVGERQRVTIARAIINEPTVLLADEPTGALDPKTAREVFDLILALCAEKQTTLLLVTHDLELAARLPKQFDCRPLVMHRSQRSAEVAA